MAVCIIFCILALACKTDGDCLEYPSQIAYIAFTPDGSEARVAALAGWDETACEAGLGNGAEVRFSRAEGYEVSNLLFPRVPRDRDLPEFQTLAPEPPPAFDVSIASVGADTPYLDAWHPESDFFVRIETIDRPTVSKSDFLVSFLDVSTGELLDEVLLY